MTIQIENLAKSYGSTPVLSDIHLQLEPGNVYCLIGVNGAGKSTLLNLISGVLSPSSGTISYSGITYKQIPDAVKIKMGILSEHNPLIEELTPRQYLSLIGKIYKLGKYELEERMNDLLAYFFETPPPEKRLSTYSTGMKKKIGLCAAIIHAPDLLLLDEPFAGLDPLSAELCVRFLNEYKNNNRIILVASHEMNLVEKVASQMMVIDKGKLIFNNTLSHFLKDKGSIDQAVIEVLSAEKSQEKSIKKSLWT